MGFWAAFMILSIPIDIYHFIHRFIGNAYPADPSMVRRFFLSEWLGFGLAGIAGGISAFGFAETIVGPKLSEVEVPIPNLPDGLVGFKIAQISDLHVGPTIRRDYVEKVVQKVNSAEPHIIAVTGDLADGHPTHLQNHFLPLKQLKAELGTYYVTGNHEYYWNVESWLNAVKDLGFIPLLNENKIIQHQSSKILIAGITDSMGEQFDSSHKSDIRKALPPESGMGDQVLKILLAHRPNACYEAEPLGFDLQLSGHTHAGQFFPWSLFLPLVYRYYKGLNRHGKMWLYVNSGTGYWGPPNRFLIPSEITLIRFIKA